MLLYHGSNIEVIQPHLLRQLRGLDFGAGFYLTSGREQAERFSRNIRRRAKSGAAIVSVYEFDDEAVARLLDILRFPSADAGWLEFVTANRLKTYQG
jgi:hypothetical protein